MNRWNDIPNEVLLCVLSCLLSRKDIHQCTLVSKQWFAICQPKIYYDINVKFDLEDNLFHTLLHSRFEPGQWVRQIFLKNLKPPNNGIQTLDSSTDSLVILMKCCPNVVIAYIDIDLSSYNSHSSQDVAKNDAVEYILKAHAKINKWKLRAMPVYVDFSNKSHRYRLADCMQGSLRSLYLDDVRDRGTFDYLAGYKSLTHITLSAKDMTDYIQVFKHTPALERLKVWFSERRTSISAANKDIWNNIYPCPALKRVNFGYYSLSSDQELLYMISQFKSVKRFDCRGSWYDGGRISFSPTVINAFVGYLQTIPCCKVQLYVSEEAKWVESYLNNSS